MAKKFKGSKRRKHSYVPKTSRRRHRVGATALNFSATSPLVKWGSVLLGFMKPDLLPIQKLVGDKLDSKIVAGGEVGLGFLLAMKKGKKNLVTTVLGGYLLGAGVKNGMAAFGIGAVGPYGRVPVIGGRVNGPYGNMPVIGYTPNHQLGAYTPSGTLGGKRVMGSVNNEGASGYMASDPGSSYMN